MASNVQFCKWCNLPFTDMQALTTHESSHNTPIKESYTCDECRKTFSMKKNLLRHIKSLHGNERYSCNKCKVEFNRKANKLRHEKTCGHTPITYECKICSKKCTSTFRLDQHMSTKHTKSVKEIHKITPSPPVNQNMPDQTSSSVKHTRKKATSYGCKCCSTKYPDRRQLYIHQMTEHYRQSGRGRPLLDRPFDDDNAPWLNEDGSIDTGLRDNYSINAPIILEPSNQGPVFSTYNVPISNDLDLERVMLAAEEVYMSQPNSFRINLSFGVILRNIESGEYRYFRPYVNADVLPQPMLMVRHRDLEKLRRELTSMSIIDHLLTQRSNTRWKPILVTNIVFSVYTTNYVIGKGGITLPDFIKKHKAIVSLERNKKTGKPINDNLCTFRCLCLHNGIDIKSLEQSTKQLLEEWVAYQTSIGKKCPTSVIDFPGIDISDLPDFEECFRVNINVMMLTEDKTAQSVYLSRCRFEGQPMYVNLYTNHFSFIKNIDMFSKRYQCFTCDRLFDQIGNLKRHRPTCSSQTKFVYPGGYFQPPQTLFEKLEHQGIDVNTDDRTFEWFIVFDFESMLKKVDIQTSPHLRWTQENIPISVSICSNVPDFKEPQCIIEPNLDTLVCQMVGEMRLIADKVKELAKEKWGWVKAKLKEAMSKLDDRPSEEGGENEDESGDAESECVNRCKTPEQKGCASEKRYLQRLYSQLKGYMKQVPVLGFNSAKYDMNLIKKKLARFLDMHTEEGAFVIKRNNAYACVVSDQFKFLDISNFLGPGTSYDKFLKAYDVEMTKGYFPYEYLDDVSKLDERSLPPRESFFSTLKNANMVTEEEYLYCQKIWSDNNMSTFRDFLVWYNNLDVEPFVTAVERLQTYYFRRNVDIFKTSISIPGIARQLLFRTARKAGANFSLYDEKNKDLYETVKNNIIGGPSIIFNRHAKASETYIRNNPEKPCQKIRGDDANALYLWAIGQNMPVGAFIRRRRDNDFRPEKCDKWTSAYHWMNYLNSTTDTDIRHKLNYGSEKRVGQYPVDGWDPRTETIYQYHGCYFHGHDCDVTRYIKDDTRRKQQSDKFKKTTETTKYLRENGYKVIEKWECEIRKDRNINQDLKTFICQNTPSFFNKYPCKVNEGQILNGVRNGTLFGMVEADIEVPNQWEGSFKSNRSPEDYFGEMSPLFCTTEVPFEVIGEHMQEHVEHLNLSKKPRRLLVGGMKGQQMLIATPLLRWYLAHGMKVTKIYQVVEYQTQSCFKEFVKEVSDGRRCGDISPDKAIIGETSKIEGNSGYGCLIMDKTKHRKTSYVQGEKEVCLLVNKPQFRKLDCLEPEEQYYEVEMAKSKITLDLPIQLGYFILQYAKLRMLEYYYDFLDVYVDRADFEYLEMDTDSAYYAISGQTLDEVIKPEMREQYFRGIHGFCDRDEIVADSENHWFPRSCCPKHAKYDKRTPGLFKLEFEGDEMIGLCSKTYIVRRSKINRPSLSRLSSYGLLRRVKRLRPRRLGYIPYTSNDYKFSSKGISKRNLKAPMSIFNSVLKTKKSRSGLNKGFRVKNNTIFTYSQERYGFTYYYCKREVLGDGIHTKPLQLTLCPITRKKEECEIEGSQAIRVEEMMEVDLS